MQGDSPGREYKRAIHLFANLLNVQPGQSGEPARGNTASNTPPLVLAGFTSYILFCELYTQLDWKSYTNEVATASFELVARSNDDPDEYLIAFFGIMELKTNE